MKTFNQAIRKLRKESELSLQELSDRTGLSVAYLSRLEAGDFQSLPLAKCKILADGLNMSLRDFLSELGFLDNKEKPSDKLIAQALRGNGYTPQQIKNIIAYAKFIKERKL